MDQEVEGNFHGENFCGGSWGAMSENLSKEHSRRFQERVPGSSELEGMTLGVRELPLS